MAEFRGFIEHEHILLAPFPGRNARAYTQPWPSQLGLRVSSADNAFVRKGSMWFIRFDGGKTVAIPHCVGLTYLHRLLCATYVPLHVSHLVDDPAVTNPSKQTLLDSQAVRQLRAAVADAHEELAEAQEWGDQARIGPLKANLLQLQDELARSAGSSGRSRNFSDGSDRDRQRVAQALRSALGKIRAEDAELHEHLLESLRNRAGWEPSYMPLVPRSWVLL